MILGTPWGMGGRNAQSISPPLPWSRGVELADQSRSVLWVDAGGGATMIRQRTATGMSTIQADIIAVSHADYNEYWEGDLVVNSTPSPTSGEYQSVTQIAILSFLCVDGTIATLRLPAPQLSIFLADNITVDATVIATLIADCIGNLQSATGSLAAAYLSGFLAAR